MYVRILEKEFQVACASGQENALDAAARLLDEKMRVIRREGRVIGSERIAITAALNIANELLALKQGTKEDCCGGHVDADVTERLKALQTRIDGVLGTSTLRNAFHEEPVV